MMGATRWVCGIYLLAQPFLYQFAGGDVSAHDFARVVQLPLLLLAALELLISRKALPAVSPGVFALLICMGLFATVSVVGAAYSGVAIREVSLYAGLSALSVVLARDSNHEVPLSMFALAATFSYGLVLLLVLASMLAAGHPVFVWDLPLGFDNPRFFNHVQTAAIPLMAGLSLYRPWPMGWRWMALGALTAQLLLLIATTGRATMTALVVAGAVLAVTLGARAWPWLRNLVGCTALAMLLYLLLKGTGPGLFETVGYQLSTHELGSSHSRLYLWEIALEHIRAAPWFGVGPMHFAHYVNAKGAHPHNAYLQLAAEFGLPFAVLVILLGLRGIRAMALQLRVCNDAGQLAMGAGLFASCVAIAVDACFSGNLVMPNSQVWSFAVFGMARAWFQLAQKSPITFRSNSQVAMAGGGAGRLPKYALLAMVLWMNIASLNEYRIEVPRMNVGRVGEQEGASVLTTQRRPRFWSEGWF